MGRDGLEVQPPPHSMEAEQSVLGALLEDNAAFDALAGLPLMEADFYRAEHRLIWRAASRLLCAGLPADVVTVFESLRNEELAQEAGGLQYLHQLAVASPGARNALAYAGIVRHRSVCRRLMAEADALNRAARDAGPQDDLHELVDAVMVRLLALQQGSQGKEPRAIGELLPPWIDALQERADGRTDAIATDLQGLDRLMMGGLRRGELMVVGARPSMGKSALSLTIARNVSRRGPVLVCSMEDSEQMLVSRQVAATGRINLADIRNPAAAPPSIWEGVNEGVEALSGLQLHIDDQPALALRDVRRKAMQVKRVRGDLLLVIVDYLQLMQGAGNNRHEVLGAIAAGLKTMAKEMQCCVMLLSQLNREADKGEGPPRLDHLRESGGIEEAADIVGLLWREHRRKPRPDNKHDAQIELAKHKSGPTDTVRLWFDGATQRFEDMSYADAH
jgi:replicative DNA helicase